MFKVNSMLPDTQTADPEEIFELLDILGQGAYGSVSKALHKPTGELYAIKILPATNFAEIETIKKQIEILKVCNSEHIVKFYGNYLKDNNLWIVLEYCIAGSIIDLINITQKKLNEYQIASILESVLQGLVYLHERKKIHRDIKAANILLNKQGVAKLADFGVSTQSKFTNAGHRTQTGSPYWMSPEVMKSSEYTNKTDIWSLGVTAIELAQGVVPNSNLKPLQAMWRLKDKPIQQLKQPEKWSAEFNSFVHNCLQINPDLRPDAKTLLNHPFIKQKSKGRNLLAELVTISMNQIQQFRMGQQESEPDHEDILNFLNSSGLAHESKTIINNITDRSKRSSNEPFHKKDRPSEELCSSMIINDQQNGSVIINNDLNSSTIVKEAPKKGNNYLNEYINKLKNADENIVHQKEIINDKIAHYDEECLNEIETLFKKYQQIIKKLIHEDASIDHQFIQKQIKSKLLISQNVKKFICSFDTYKDLVTEKTIEIKKSPTEFIIKKKSQSSQSIQKIHKKQTKQETQDLKQMNSRAVKSLQFNQFFSKANDKFGFNSNSVISDIQNVKHKEQKINNNNKRFIATEPHQWIERRPFQNQKNILNGDTTKLKNFLLDPDVKQSLLSHLYNGSKTTDKKSEDSSSFTHQKSNIEVYHKLSTQVDDWKYNKHSAYTKQRGTQDQNNFSQQQYLIEQKNSDEEQHKIPLFKVKQNQIKVKKQCKQKNKNMKNLGWKRQGHSGEKKNISSKGGGLFNKNKSIANFLK